LPEDLRRQATKLPQGDKLVAFNRALLEHAFPGMLATRAVYPFRPGWGLTLGCVVSVLALVVLALRQTGRAGPAAMLRRPWRTGLGFTAAFVVIGFVLPSVVEHGVRIPAVVDCGLWCGVAVWLGRVLRRMDGAGDRPWRRGLWALGVITPWVLFAVLLGVCVRVIGAKSFAGMPFVALAFGAGILGLAIKWRRRLEPDKKPVPEIAQAGL
jgi:hypothetical protein